jgi:transcriptional regulator with XRE-family HTH domain
MDNKSLGRFIRYVRAKRRIDRKDLALELGISYAHLNNIELGDRPPSIDLIIELANHLNIEPGVLLNVLSGWISIEDAQKEFDRNKNFLLADNELMELRGINLTIPEILEDDDIDRIVDYIKVLSNSRTFLNYKNIDSSGKKIKPPKEPEITPASLEASSITLRRQKEQAEARKRRRVQDIQTSYPSQDQKD